MTKTRRRLQQRLHFLAAQDQRQLSFAPRKRYTLDGDFPAQRVGIEEPQRTYHLNAGGSRDLLLFDQEQLIAPNMLRTKLIGRFHGPRLFRHEGLPIGSPWPD